MANNIDVEKMVLTFLGGTLRLANLFSSTVSSKMLYWLWRHPIKYKAKPSEIAYKKKAQTKTFEFMGNTYRAYSWGEGPNVFLMHGWDGRGTQLASFIDPLVKKGFRVITFDAHAHGESVGNQATPVLIKDMVVKVEKLYGGFTYVISHSVGSLFVLLSLTENFSIDRLVLISPTQNLWLTFQKVKARLGVPRQAEEKFLAALEHDYPDCWNYFSNERMVKSLQQLPVLIIHDEDDDYIPVNEGRELHSQWSGSEFIATRGLGHRKILRDSGVVNSAVEFLTRTEYQKRKISQEDVAEA